MYYPFDSRNKLYKSKFGAVAEGESLRLRLLLHKDIGVNSAYLRINKDMTKDIHETNMIRSYVIEDYCTFECEISLKKGLYFYSFRYITESGEFFITSDKHKKGIVSDQGNWWQITCYDRNFETPDWLKGGIIYQIFPDRFFSSENSKQNIPTDRYLTADKEKIPEYRQNNGICSLGNDYYCGDLEGITKKLSYLKSLGVSCIYLNPIFEAQSNHRYNTADYMNIDPLLGNEKDLKHLCRSAKKAGISVILDGVFSHTGDDSIYFNKYGRYDSVGAYNNPHSNYRDWYKFDNSDLGYKAWWGVPSMPEIIEENEDFCEYITGKNGVIKKWLKCGIRGWRLDVADELPDVFLDKLRISLKEEDPDALILGEVWEDASNKISYNQRRRYLQGDQLDSVMNYPFAKAVIDYVKGGDGFVFMDSVLDILENYPKPVIDVLMNHLGTHDTKRILTELGTDSTPEAKAEQATFKLNQDQKALAIKRLRLAAVLSYTLPGVPSLFYGDEAGLEGFGDPFCRAFYPWGKENKELLDFYTSLGKMRRNNEVFKDGEFVPIIGGLGTLAYIRQNSNHKILIAVNRWCDKDTILVPTEFNNAKALFGAPPIDSQLTINAEDFTILII